jgi:hypothetical protein
MSVPSIRFSDPDDLSVVLEGLRDVLARHPIAAQAAFAALASEGRRFAKTPEGDAWRARLVVSDLFDRVRLLWKSVGIYAFVERPRDMLPSAFLEGAIRAASKSGLESLLSKIFDDRDS